MTGVDRANKPESVVALLGGNARLVFGLATALLLAGGGLLFWLLQSAVRRLQRCWCLQTGEGSAAYQAAQCGASCGTCTCCCTWPNGAASPHEHPCCRTIQGNPLAPKMLYAAIAMGYIYQGPPFRWGRGGGRGRAGALGQMCLGLAWWQQWRLAAGSTRPAAAA